MISLDLSPEPLPLRVDEDNVVRVGPTRVTLDTVVGAFEQFLAPEEIRSRYPSLELADIYLAIGFYLRHKPEVTAYLDERARLAEEVRRLNEERCPPEGVRERLLARKASMEATSR